ncbi:MAG: GDSL-type esterase/lipase family protein [Bryobacteraceae bacterium]|jgi:lysophospholipase L1-like esterase
MTVLGPAENPQSSGKRSPWRRILIAVSVLMNVAALGGLVNVIEGRGGFAYLKSYLTHRSGANENPAFLQRQSLYELLSTEVHPRPIVFLGDSLTANCEWRELLGNRGAILNRGIGGETSADALKRSAGVAGMHPLAVFLMVGDNDPQELGYAPADTLDNDREIVRTIHQVSPDTVIYLQSLLPTAAPKFNRWSEQVNRGLAAMADGDRLRFINLRPAFLRDGVVGKEFVVDGIHLSGKGYLLWKKGIESEVSRWIASQELDHCDSIPAAESPARPVE